MICLRKKNIEKCFHVLQSSNLLDVHCLVSIVTKQCDVTDVGETWVLIIHLHYFFSLLSQLMKLLVLKNCLFFLIFHGGIRIRKNAYRCVYVPQSSSVGNLIEYVGRRDQVKGERSKI